jgi:hypothetical protein
MRLLVIDKISPENARLIAQADRVIDFTGQSTAGSKNIECSTEYNGLRTEIREKYIKYIACLGEERIGGKKIKEIFLLNKRCSLWWFSEIVHKDTFNDPFFDDLCKTIFIQRLKERLGVGEILLSCAGGSLLRTVFAGAKGPLFPFILKALVSRLRLMVNYLKIKVKLRQKKIKDSAPAGTLFFSYYPNNWNRDSQGRLSDRIFRDLPSRLKNSGYILCLGAVNDDLTETGPAAYIQNNLTFWGLISRFLDLRNAFRYMLVRNKMREFFSFAGIDISPVYDRYLWYTVLLNDYYDALVAVGVANIAKKIAPKQIVSAGEFGAMARAVVAGAKTKNIPVIWLQHAVISRGKLWYFNAPEEIVDRVGEINTDFIQRMPVADRFLVWGKSSIEALRDYGYPPERMRIVGNPRYDDFIGIKTDNNADQSSIVFTPTIDEKEIVDFIGLAIGLKAKQPEKLVVLKLHPRYRDIIRGCETELAAVRLAGVKIATEPIDRYFHRSNIFVCGVSTTAIEAAYHGVRVVTFISRYYNRFTPDWTSNDDVAYSLDELLARLKTANQGRSLSWEQYYQPPGGATAAVMTELDNVSAGAVV